MRGSVSSVQSGGACASPPLSPAGLRAARRGRDRGNSRARRVYAARIARAQYEDGSPVQSEDQPGNLGSKARRRREALSRAEAEQRNYQEQARAPAPHACTSGFRTRPAAPRSVLGPHSILWRQLNSERQGGRGRRHGTRRVLGSIRGTGAERGYIYSPWDEITHCGPRWPAVCVCVCACICVCVCVCACAARVLVCVNKATLCCDPAAPPTTPQTPLATGGSAVARAR